MGILRQPTPGEAALRQMLLDPGWQVLLPTAPPFHVDEWLYGQSPYDDLTPATAVAEAGVGRSVCDVLLPHTGIVIAVEGGIHARTRDRDARRQA